jgi:hypothetical protein
MSSLFKKPKVPTPKPVVPMPDPEGPEAEAARRRALEAARARSGRASTMLSGEYEGSKLGTP